MHAPFAPTHMHTHYTLLHCHRYALDNALPLVGDNSVLGRSIVIHKANGDRWACANIGSAGVGATVTFPEEAGQPSGSIELFQPSAFWDTAMIVDLAGLEGGNKWHVHAYPVPGSGDCLGTGGHFDPAGADYAGSDSAAPPPYEYGDLSGKHGKLEAGATQDFLSDSTLPLSGSMSVLGRSIVIHKADGSRWACATIPMRILVSFPDLGPSYPFGSILLYQDKVTSSDDRPRHMPRLLPPHAPPSTTPRPAI